MLHDRSREPSRVPGLDGWRGVSIAMVIVGHFVSNRYKQFRGSIFEVIPLGELGVEIFFIISGYIICKLALREAAETGRFDTLRFWARRLFRIAPPLCVYLASVAVIFRVTTLHEPSSYIVSAAMFACDLPGVECGWTVGHSWSLAVEEQFYLLFPLLLWAGRRHAKLLFGLLCLTLVVLSRQAIGGALLGDPGKLISKFVAHFIPLFVGVQFALHEPRIKELSRRHFYPISGVAAIFMVIMLLDQAGITSVFASSRGRLMSLLQVTIQPLAMAWLVVATSLHPGPIRRALESRPLRGLGLISYSLYLWQQIFLSGGEFFSDANILRFWPGMFPIAILSYFLVEKPSTRLARTLIKQRSAPRAAPARLTP